MLVLREVVIDVGALELGSDDIGSWEGIDVGDAKWPSRSPGIRRVSPELSRNGSKKASKAESVSISNSRRWSWELAVDGMPTSDTSSLIDP